MSDPTPMTPDQAIAELASGFPTRTTEYILERAIRAMETIALMSMESTYHVEDDNPDAFALRQHVRYVTEWRVDE